MSDWLGKIVSTTLVVVTGCIISITLTLFYMLATLFGKQLDPVLLGSMLAFAASCMGIGYKQFKAKRETAWAEDDEGVAYKPLNSTAWAEQRKNRYDVGAFPPRTPIREIGSASGFGQPGGIDEPESVEERENGGHTVAPPPVVEEEWEEEGA